jgi:hypothetical protein
VEGVFVETCLLTRLPLVDWCNVNGAGFGKRPTGDTGFELADAFVWVKPGGESDGTSDTSANRYDSFCGKPDGKSYIPSSHSQISPPSSCRRLSPQGEGVSA